MSYPLRPASNGVEARLDLILDELRTLNRALGHGSSDAAPVPLTGLPDDFPGSQSLRAAGIARLDQVPRSRDQLSRINGIGPRTASRILEALGVDA